MLVKVCGMNSIDNLKALAKFQPDYFGFIFYEKSPRFMSQDKLPDFSNIIKIGVFVNEDDDYILNTQNQFNLQGIQLHGDESAEQIKRLKTALPLGTALWKAISIRDAEDFKQ